MTRPFVSVLIDTYNHEGFIEQALVSVLEQGLSAEEMEVIVVDDGSADNTSAIVRKFAPRVRYLFKPNGGQASAFNIGIPEMHGEIASFLDGDDWWAQDKLPKALEQLARNPDIGAVGHGYYEVYPNGQRPRAFVLEKPYRLHLGDLATASLFSHLRCFLGTSRITIRKGILDRVLPVPEELVVEADEFIFTLAVAIGGALILDEPLFHYRLHGGNLFQFGSNDPVKYRRKQTVLVALLRTLPSRLAELGVAPEVVRAVMEPVWVDAERIRLRLDGGWPWETFSVERAAYRLAYRDADFGYGLFKAAALALTALLPPRRFYRFRQWYAEKNLRELRKVIGEPTPAAPVIERRMEI